MPGCADVNRDPGRPRPELLDLILSLMGETGVPQPRPVPVRLLTPHALPLPAFDPASCQRSFRLGMTEDAAAMLLPGLVDAMREQAPLAQLILRQADSRMMRDQLVSGDIATLIDGITDLAVEGTYRRVLGRSDWVVLRDPQTPAVDRLDAFCARPHVVVSAGGQPQDHVDAALATLGRQRRVMTALPTPGLLPSTLRGTDLVAVVPAMMAQCLHGLCADAPPVSLTPLAIAMAWHDAADRDPAERWFRALLAHCHRALQLAGGLTIPPAPRLVPVARAA